jgi:membrane protease subunit HflK
MPWSNQGGGPWQPKNQGPWGQGPQGGNNGGPPNLEDLLRRGQEQLRNILPGGGGAGGGFGARGIAFIILILLLIWALTGLYTVRPNEVGINMVFGKYESKTLPGLRYNWPSPIGAVQKVRVTDVNTMQIGATGQDSRRGPATREDSLMLTGDERIVDIDFTVFWVIQADKPEDFVFNLKDPRGTIRAVAESAIREVVGRSELRNIVSGPASRSQVEADVKGLMQRVLDEFNSGVTVNNINVRTLDVPQPVIEALGWVGDAVSWMTGRVGLLNSNKVALGRAEYWLCSAERARRELGFAPGIGLAEGMRATYAWYRERRWL